MGFTSNEKPYYDLGNNGYLPENTDFHKDIIANWKQYIQEHPGELVYIPTAFTATTRINQLLRAHEFDKDGNHLDSELILPNFFDPVALRNNLNTGSSIVDFVLQHNITGGKNFTTKDTEFAKPIDTKIGFVNDMMKSYLDSSSQPLHNLNGKIPRAQIWRYYLRTVDDHFAQFPMMQELIIIGLIHSGDLNEPHLSPHMLKYCKLNLTYRDCYPHGFKHAQMAAFSHTHGHTGHNKPLIWTLDDHHINGIETVCEKLDLHLYSFLRSTLPKFLLDHAANNSEIERSGVNLISYINKSFGKLSYADGAEIKHQLDNWKKLSITTAPLKSLNAFHEKYLLYQDIRKPKNGNISMKDREQTIKHAIISLLGDDYGDERTVSLSEQVQHDESRPSGCAAQVEIIKRQIKVIYAQATLRNAKLVGDDIADASPYEEHQAEGMAFFNVIFPWVKASINAADVEVIGNFFDVEAAPDSFNDFAYCKTRKAMETFLGSDASLLGTLDAAEEDGTVCAASLPSGASGVPSAPPPLPSPPPPPKSLVLADYESSTGRVSVGTALVVSLLSAF